MKKKIYQICTKCVMDTTDPDIQFDEQGICNHCHSYQKRWDESIQPLRDDTESLSRILDKVKKEGHGKRYDSILGVSGGVDSTYTALLAKEYGLRPLVVHLDNGWNSETATQNINNIIDRLGFDLHTHVIDWPEFRDIQLSLLKASVVDLEVVTDHAIFAIIRKLVRKYNIKYNITGFNFETEAILPKAWRWNKLDWLNIKSIHEQFGSVPFKTFPHIGFFKKWYSDKILNLLPVKILNYYPYNKEEAKRRIAEELGWQDYGGKHYESIITRFYQGYILPRKFGIDKRKAHLATLINSNQISRTAALEELKTAPYDPNQLKIDKEFVLKKFQLSEKAFEDLMELPIQPHTAFPSYTTKHYENQIRFFKTIRPVTQLIKKVTT